MEKDELEQNQVKSIYDRVGNVIFLIVVALLGISTTFIYDTYKLTGVALAWVVLFFAYLIYDDLKIRAKCKKIESDDASKQRIKELFLKQLMDPRTASGHDFTIKGSKHLTFTMELHTGSYFEILVFSQKKFAIALFNKTNFGIYDAECKKLEKSPIIDVGTMKRLNIEPVVAFGDISFIKTRIIAESNGLHTFCLTRADDSDKKDIEISFIVSDIPRKSPG